MDELMRIVRVNREYAEEKRDAIEVKYKAMAFWSNDDTTDYEYWSGQMDALERVLLAWESLGYKVREGE